MAMKQWGLGLNPFYKQILPSLDRQLPKKIPELGPICVLSFGAVYTSSGAQKLAQRGSKLLYNIPSTNIKN
jgi:hypothetical protein